MLALGLLPAFHETFGLLVLLVLLLDYALDDVIFLFVGRLNSIHLHGVDRGLFLRRHVEYLEKIINIEVIEVERFQDDLADHEINILFLKFYLFEKLVEFLLRNGTLGVALVIQGLEDMLLILGH